MNEFSWSIWCKIYCWSFEHDFNNNYIDKHFSSKFSQSGTVFKCSKISRRLSRARKCSQLSERTIFKFWFSDEITFFSISLLVSPCNLFSECPKIIYSAPIFLIIVGLTDPVKGPYPSWWWQFCAPREIYWDLILRLYYFVQFLYIFKNRLITAFSALKIVMLKVLWVIKCFKLYRNYYKCVCFPFLW